jgi:hypothetical protein
MVLRSSPKLNRQACGRAEKRTEKAKLLAGESAKKPEQAKAEDYKNHRDR